MKSVQPGILATVPRLARYMEFSLVPDEDVRPCLEALREIADGELVVVGLGASAVAAPLPILESQAKVPAIAFYVHLPTMLIVLALFRIFIFRAGKTGHFERWNGIPLVAVYVCYTIVQYVVS